MRPRLGVLFLAVTATGLLATVVALPIATALAWHACRFSAPSISFA